MARVVAVCTSEKKGTRKKPADAVELREEYGIIGDAHAGNWHRQVSLLGVESVRKMQERVSIQLKPGDFAENILTEGISLYKLPVGTRLRIGDVECEITQIGKECHADCAIRKQTGYCVMPTEGIFVRILNPGTIRAGDKISVLDTPAQA